MTLIARRTAWLFLPNRYTFDEGSLEPPFKGLQFFDEADADLFFGREELIARLLGPLGFSQDGLTTGNNLLFIVGASGSGKSSLVRCWSGARHPEKHRCCQGSQDQIENRLGNHRASHPLPIR